MASDAEVAVAGVRAHVEAFTLEHEGFRDDAAINLNPDAHAVAVDRIAFYDERKRRAEVFIAAGLSLIEHGYPDVPVLEVSPEVLANFRSNADSIQAALRKLGLNTATGLKVSGGTTEFKGPVA